MIRSAIHTPRAGDGRYDIGERIGRGAMGEVYRARDTALLRDVAVKTLPADVAEDERRLARLQREGRVLAALNHPHIATLHDVAAVDGRPALVMELVEGETLHDRIRSGGRLSPDDALAVAVQIASALEAAHAGGIVHCDLKPSNVMLRPDGQVKVLDFGLALLAEPLDEDSVEKRSTLSADSALRLRGTPAYLSPERVAGEPPDAQSDVWALGCVLFEMLTGRRAFGRDSLPETIQAIRDARPDLSLLPARTPPLVHSIVRRCLHPDRPARFATMHDARVLLEEACRARVPVAGWRRFWRAAAAAMVLALATGALLWWGLGGGPVQEGRPPHIRSVAVLPLANLSARQDDDWFTDGMTEALIGELSRIGRLRVISRTSTMRYRGTRKSVPEIAGELEVDAILTGTVTREGNQVRVTAQLFHGATETRVWSETFQRELGSVLALHGDIALTVARQIRIAVSPPERARLTHRQPVDPEAYEAFLKGRYLHSRLDRSNVLKAVEYLQQALARHPDYPEAAAELALAYGHLGRRSKAMELAGAAVRLDGDLAATQAAFGWASFWHLDFAGAERAFLKALSIEPSNAYAHHGYAYCLTTLIRLDEAIGHMRQARGLDPLSYWIALAAHWPYYCARRYEEAARELNAAADLEPRSPLPLLFLANVRSFQGRPDAALQALEKAASLDAPRAPHFLTYLAGAHARAGRRAAALKAVDELESLSARGAVSPVMLARAHASVGSTQQALALLERAYDDPIERWELSTTRDPAWDGIREHPRFVTLLRNLGVPVEPMPH